MANPSPTIVFQVDLSTLNQRSDLSADMYQSSAALGRQAIINQASTRVSWLPGMNGADNLKHVHGDTFTLYGLQAQYYRAEIAKGNFPELSVVSATI